MTTESTNMGGESLDVIPLCDEMFQFREAFVGFCDNPTAEAKEKLSGVLHEIEDTAHTLRDQLDHA